MKDLHSHIIYDIDDGSSSISESVNIIKRLYEAGYTDLIITPHYKKDSNYCCNNKEKIIRLNKIKESVKDLNINLFLGNEVYISDTIIKDIKAKRIATLNNSRYVLIEFPFYNRVNSMHDVIFELVNNGYIPIIAHPERYTYLASNIDEYIDLINEGALLQGNVSSLYNKYGYSAKKTLKKLLRLNLITFLSTDIHKENTKYLVNEKKLKIKLKFIIKDDIIIDSLINENIEKVINDEFIG